jgi:tRNA (cmo5U34)-methyltransferase
MSSIHKDHVTTERLKEVPITSRDQLFADQNSQVSDFHFDQKTAAVFDDMVNRSVPQYEEMQRMTAEIANDFAVPGTSLFDLGCATGTTLIYLDPVIEPSVRFVGIDNSREMLDKAQEKINICHSGREFELFSVDMHREMEIENASVVVMILTLQFIRPLHRAKVIQRIFDGMNDQAALIIFEKITLDDSLFNRLFIRHYYEMKKRQGYSEIEISQKREALENVLIPYRPEENRELLANAGFTHIEEFFRWYNFSGIIAVK